MIARGRSGVLTGVCGEDDAEARGGTASRGERKRGVLALRWREEGARGGLGGSAAVGMLATARAACSGVGEEDDRRVAGLGRGQGGGPRWWATGKLSLFFFFLVFLFHFFA